MVPADSCPLARQTNNVGRCIIINFPRAQQHVRRYFRCPKSHTHTRAASVLCAVDNTNFNCNNTAITVAPRAPPSAKKVTTLVTPSIASQSNALTRYAGIKS